MDSVRAGWQSVRPGEVESARNADRRAYPEQPVAAPDAT